MMSDASFAETLRVLIAQLAIFQALLLAASALHKAATWPRALDAVRQFARVPEPFARPVLTALVAAEAVAGALLVVPAYRPAGALLAALIYAGYLAFIIRAIVQERRDVDCGCSFGPTARPLGTLHVIRGLVLTFLALLVAGASVDLGVAAVVPSQGLGGLALLALYGALDQVMALRPLRSGEVL
jgi:hypothetical protein